MYLINLFPDFINLSFSDFVSVSAAVRGGRVFFHAVFEIHQKANLSELINNYPLKSSENRRFTDDFRGK